MEGVKRYNMYDSHGGFFWDEKDDGDWVKYEDYAAIANRVAQLEQANLAYCEETVNLRGRALKAEAEVAHLAESDTELAMLEIDASRYRWLRERPATRNAIAGGVPWTVVVRSEHGVPTMGACYERELDTLIDHALTPKEQGNG